VKKKDIKLGALQRQINALNLSFEHQEEATDLRTEQPKLA
jgi:hypothetical protein